MQVASIEVFSPGSEVSLPSLLHGTVLEVSWDGGTVRYKCFWWAGDVRTEAWLSHFEVRPFSVENLKIGFVAQNPREA